MVDLALFLHAHQHNQPQGTKCVTLTWKIKGQGPNANTLI